MEAGERSVLYHSRIWGILFIPNQGWAGPFTCVANSSCVFVNDFYSQCLPSTGVTTTIATTSTTTARSTISTTSTTTARSTTTSTTASVTSTHTTATTTTAVSTTSTAVGSSGTCAPNSPAPGSGTLKFTGVNIAGFDFGTNSDGDACGNSMDGVGQMTHFVNDDGYNTFRLPVPWQFFANYVLGAPLNMANMAEYDTLVQACLATGASCIIDMHNYARWEGTIIGQGGPTNAQFAAIWGEIAAFYKDEPKIIFGIMNEPHDIPDINIWAATVQAAVTAIRQAGATTQMILLPGNNWTSAETFVSNGSADALKKIVNLDGSVTNLIFDVHKYLDIDNSGTHPDCTTNNIAEAWAPLAQWLRCNKRQAFNTETGGGYADATCLTLMCQQIAFQAQNSDVFLGYVGWVSVAFYSILIAN
ncbi:endoglucanase [Mycena metata]|uniref:cellulase n=1 Tax=Mycena metata TaxID=1033252 RepID=A0AAD7GYG5_9AGAR|nr:endoglucanase [Mycena metata]